MADTRIQIGVEYITSAINSWTNRYIHQTSFIRKEGKAVIVYETHFTHPTEHSPVAEASVKITSYLDYNGNDIRDFYF
jgi:hypothetical protein